MRMGDSATKPDVFETLSSTSLLLLSSRSCFAGLVLKHPL